MFFCTDSDDLPGRIQEVQESRKSHDIYTCVSPRAVPEITFTHGLMQLQRCHALLKGTSVCRLQGAGDRWSHALNADKPDCLLLQQDENGRLDLSDEGTQGWGRGCVKRRLHTPSNLHTNESWSNMAATHVCPPEPETRRADRREGDIWLLQPLTAPNTVSPGSQKSSFLCLGLNIPAQSLHAH